MSISKQLCLGLTIVLFALTWISPPWPIEQIIHALQGVFIILVLVIVVPTYPIVFYEYALVCLLIVIHAISARWLYSAMPVNDWPEIFWKQHIQTILPFSKIFYKRLVMGLYGFCMFPALMCYFRKEYQLNNKQALLPAVGVVIVGAMVYEWLEWLIELSITPSYQSDYYLSYQHSKWAIDQNMLWATLGGVIWVPYYLRLYRKQLQAQSDSSAEGGQPPASV